MTETENISSDAVDVLIAGSGVAGMYSALQFEDKTKVMILSKYSKKTSNSNLAQGGVAAVLSTQDDSFNLHIKDTLIAGGYANNSEAVDILVHEGPDDVREIIKLGVEFDKKAGGEFDKTLEAGHSRRRILHHRDRTGAELVEKLLLQVESRKNIIYKEDTMLCRLVRAWGGFRADLLKNGEYFSVFCSYCILCTGGIGRLYKYTTNAKSATGDGIRIAHELGASIKNLGYIQFHPTAFNCEDGERFLISESMRGEGARLINCRHERFMDRYDDRLELAPRDVVSRSIILESKRTGSNKFFLDITHKDADFLRKRFPGISADCLRYGVDITKDLIPVFPCQHYLMGGIEVDMDSKTTIPNLYACGECANTGAHGKNRLASNSLLEALVFSRRAAEDIKRCMAKGFTPVLARTVKPDFGKEALPEAITAEIRDIMQKAYFVFPDPAAIRSGIKQTDAILKRLKGGRYEYTTSYLEALSLATCAHIVLREAAEKILI